MLTDAEIAQMSPAQRRRLIRKLTKSLSDVAGSPEKRQRIRVLRLTVMIGAVLVLIPWIVYLGMTLPQRHTAPHWDLTWVGFDVMLLVSFAGTAAFGLLRRQLLVVSAVATGVLLICDAWFDVTTAGPDGRWLSIASALLVELPVAALALNTALRLLRLQAERMWLMPPARHLWQVPLQLEDAQPSDAQRADAAAEPRADGLAPA